MAINIRTYYKRISVSRLLMSALLFAGLTACTDDSALIVPDDPTKGESGYITINISNSNLTTRAEFDEPGIEGLNENLIKSVTLCMSPSAGDRTDDDAPAFMQTFKDLNAKNGNVTLRIPMTTELENRLFNENNSESCNVFAAVNVDPGEANTVAKLRALAITSEFASDPDLKQSSFTMDGDATATYVRASHSATSEIKVKRSAAKFTLALAVESEIKETTASGDITWKPNLKGMFVMMQQGVGISQLDPKPEPNMDDDVYFNTANALNGKYTFNYDENAKAPDESGLKYKYDYVQNIPFYSYPNKWTGNDDERHGTYLLLVVPWSNDEGKTYRTCYYHVPVVPSGTYETVRNISYHINLHVGVLGSYVPEEPFEVEADYYVAEWGNEDLNVDIKDYRYLVVDQNEYTVNNENTYSIPFYTSHPTKVISSTMTFYRYNFSDQGSEFAVTVRGEKNGSENLNAENVYEVDFDNTNKVLNIKHDLVIYTPYRENGTEVLLTRRANGTRADLDNANEIQTMLGNINYYRKKNPEEAEYSAIKFEIAVQHIDVAEGQTSYDKDKDYIEKITVWQYPGMYITAVQNYCQNLGNGWTANATLGNTMINERVDNTWYNVNADANTRTNWGDDRKLAFNYRNWDYSIGLGTPEQDYYNWNPNLYLVTITQLSEDAGKNYIIDDPRSYNINNYLANNGIVDGENYTVDGGSTKRFVTEYWYYQVGNNNLGAESDSYFGGPNPRYQYYTYSTRWWELYQVNGFKEASALDLPIGQKRSLSYYYPTRESDDNINTIAPKFRICSSYAGTRALLTREMARRRAAAYQEVGYCAGRWRLPTFGEVEYIMTLSAQEKIPRLFGTNANGTWCYWCAQGAVIVPAGNAANQEVYISTSPSDVGSDAVAPFIGDNYRARSRFVYDEWYWGSGTLTPKPNSEPSETQLQYDFTWGDQPKTNPEN